MHARPTTPRPRRGVGLLEALIAISLLAVTVLATFSLVDSSRRFAAASVEVATVEDLVQDLVYDIERELSGAAVVSPASALTAPLSQAETGRIDLASTAGFPPTGWVLLGRGTAQPEVVRYASLDPGGRALLGLTRGEGGTTASSHAAGGSDALWRGLADLIADQTNPPPGSFDGRADGETGWDYFRGHGAGLAYRVPVDPTGGDDVLGGDGVTWGAELSEFGPSATAYHALYFEPLDEFDEARFDVDVNRDGDRDDVFDVGQIRRATWDAADPTRRQDVGLSPTAVLQERGAWGADLDGDGAADPLFLHDPERRTVHVRLFLLGRSNPERPLVRSVESVLFLRNDPDA